MLKILQTPPRSTFHHVNLSGELGPICSARVQVFIFLSTALLASQFKPGFIDFCEASALKERSSEEKNETHECIYKLREWLNETNNVNGNKYKQTKYI